MLRLIQHLAEGVRRALDRPERWLIRCVIVAAIIAVVHYSGDKAKDVPTQAILIFLGLAAVGFHYLGAKRACQSWFERRGVAFLLWLCVVSGAIVWEVNSQLSVASNNQDNIRATRVAGWNGQEDARAELTRATTRLGAERKALEAVRDRITAASRVEVNGTPVTSPEVAQQLVDRLKGQTRLWTLTKGCSETAGAQTRAYCDQYRAATAAKALAENRLVLESEARRQEAVVTEAETALAAARQGASQAATVVSVDRADLRSLKRLTGLSDGDVELSQALLIVVVMALFLTVAGWLEKAEEYAGQPRRAWLDWRGIASALRFLVTGQKGPAGRHTIIERTTIIDPKGTAFAQAAR